MQIFQKFYVPAPGDRNETASNEKNEDKNDNKDANEHHDKKSVKEKIKDALQQWSNDDARDIEEDDSSPLRSGL